MGLLRDEIIGQWALLLFHLKRPYQKVTVMKSYNDLSQSTLVGHLPKCMIQLLKRPLRSNQQSIGGVGGFITVILINLFKKSN